MACKIKACLCKSTRSPSIPTLNLGARGERMLEPQMTRQAFFSHTPDPPINQQNSSCCDPNAEFLLCFPSSPRVLPRNRRSVFATDFQRTSCSQAMGTPITRIPTHRSLQRSSKPSAPLANAGAPGIGVECSAFRRARHPEKATIRLYTICRGTLVHTR